MGICADNQRVTSSLCHETKQCSKLGFLGDEMFPVCYEQIDRGLCASAQMSARGLSGSLAALLTSLANKVGHSDLLIQKFFKMSMFLL